MGLSRGLIVRLGANALCMSVFSLQGPVDRGRGAPRVDDERISQHTIVVQVESALVEFRGVGESPVTLIDAVGNRRALRRTSKVGRWSLEGVADGEYSLAIDERPFAPWRIEGVQLGQTVRAALRGDATITLELLGLDGVTAHRVNSVFARHLDDSSGRRGRALVPSAPGTYSELPAGTIDLEVRAEGLPIYHVRVKDLASGEVRPVRVRATTLGALRGVLRDEGGAPLAGRRIEVTRGEVHGHAVTGVTISDWRMVGGEERLVPIPHVEHVLFTDERGEFSLTDLEPQRYALRVPVPERVSERGTGATGLDQIVEVSLSDLRPITLIMQQLHDARIRVLLPKGIDPRTLVVRIAPSAASGRGAGSFDGATCALDSEGRCTVEGLFEGEYALLLFKTPSSGPLWRGRRPEAKLDLGGFGLGRYLYLEPGEDPKNVEHVFDVRACLPPELGPLPK